jgi:uncharacterized protein
MRAVRNIHLRLGVLGLAMGFVLSRVGFSDFGEVHRMFIFADLRLLFTFAGAVAIIAVGYAVLRARRDALAVPVHRAQVVGGMLFGAGWAITGACPSIALVQLGEGKLAAGATALGIVAGVALHRAVNARYLRWHLEACGSA